MGQEQMIGELWQLARRRWLVVAGIVGLGTLAASGFALTRPSVYETAAKVLIESQQIPDELARSTVTLSTAARLQMIEQRLMARDTVASLIERLGLFPELAALSTSDKVELLRQATRIESIPTPGATPWDSGGGVVAFTITVTLGDPVQAAAVANELAQAAIAQNLEVRFNRARDTLAYFEQEARNTAAALAAAEAELSEFKIAHSGALPEDVEPTRDALNRQQSVESDLDRQILDLETRRSQLEATLAGAPGAGGTVSASQAELQRLDLELVTRRKVLAPNHPELRRLQQQRDAVRALVAGEAKGDDAGDGTRPASVQGQIDQYGADITDLRARREALRAERGRLEAGLVRNPEVEASLQALERRVTELRERYADVARRQAEARTGAQLETNQQSERFEILETALVPDAPIGPSRLKYVALGVAASGALAAGVVLLIEMLRPSIRTARQMERRLDIRPVVSIPYVSLPGERRQRLVRWAGGLALAIAAAWIALPLVLPVEALKLRLEKTLRLGAAPQPPDAG